MKLTTHPETVSQSEPNRNHLVRTHHRTMFRPKADHQTITSRQAEVLRLIMQGLANKQIADRLKICQQTVEKHRYAIYDKAGINTTAQAVHLGISLGIGPLIRFPDIQLSDKAATALASSNTAVTA